LEIEMSTVFIPKGTEWYIGELVEEFRAADQAENLVHVNTVLIKADSPEVAYEKALALGEVANRVFTNTDGVDVTVRFRGLRGLYPVYDRLEDGAELLYEEHEGMSDEAIATMVKPREALAVFSPTWKGRRPEV
jgi:Domain of unknown function (DUF4288)